MAKAALRSAVPGPVLSEEERAHVEACRRHLELDVGVPTLSGQRALLSIIDRLTGRSEGR
jgi:hypothetical protein